MIKILHIDSSPRGDLSVTRKLSRYIVENLQKKYGDFEVRELDLIKNPIPHLDESHIAAFFTPAEQQSEAHKKVLVHSETALRDLLWADYIVIGVPMFNFGLPSGLKAWVDQIVRAGVTFKYTEHGPIGLISKDKKVFLAIATGGVYSEEPMKSLDFTEPYLKAVLGFIGLTNVAICRAEGLAIPGVQEHAYEKAIKSIVV